MWLTQTEPVWVTSGWVVCTTDPTRKFSPLGDLYLDEHKEVISMEQPVVYQEQYQKNSVCLLNSHFTVLSHPQGIDTTDLFLGASCGIQNKK